MSVAHPRLPSPSWPRWPRRTARIRLTALYGALFLLFGGVLVAMTYALFQGATAYRTPPIPRVPHAPAIENLQLPAPLAGTLPGELCLAQQQLAQAGEDRGPGGQSRPVGDQHRTTHPASGSRPTVPAFPAARSAPGTLQGRARARTVHRPGHRDRTRRHHHRPPRARRRPLRERHLPAARERGRISGTSFPKRPAQPRDRAGGTMKRGFPGTQRHRGGDAARGYRPLRHDGQPCWPFSRNGSVNCGRLLQV
jgi:hypothetical protein